MAHENPLWGAPRIHGEMLKLGLDVAQATVSPYMPRGRTPSSQTWNVTDSPAVQWTGRQLVEAFPWDTAPRFLLRDRDAVYGPEFLRSARTLGIEDVRTSPRSPWQNPYVERLIGSIRRECLDHVVIVNENHLRHVLHEYLSYYSEARTHLGLEKDSPETRAIEPPEAGRVVALPRVGGLHHRYTRRAA